VVEIAAANGATIIDINVEDNPFGDIAARRGAALRAPAATALPDLARHLIA
jgi:hypothetical protein